MFAGTHHFFPTARRCCWLLCLLLGGIHGGVVPAQDSSDSRVAVPSADVQQSKRTQVDGAVGLAKATTIPQKQKALRELMTMASDLGTTSDELYAVLQSAFPLIRETGDIAALRVAMQKLTETFQVDPITERSNQLEQFIAACKAMSALDPAVKDFVSLVEKAGRANRFRDAHRWLDSAEKSAKKLNAKSSLSLLDKTRTALLEREQAFVAQERSLKTLEANPEDPKANFLVGQWLAVFAGEWARALPFLAKGSDPKWQAAAKAELAVSGDLDSRLAMADAWWEVAQVATGAAKTEVQLRTYEWYSEFEPHVTSPLVKRRVTDRKTDLAKILNLKPATPDPAPTTKPSDEVVKKAVDENELPIGKSIDLLEMVKLPDHAVLGNWKRLDDAIVCEANFCARFMVPVVVTGSYQLTCKFTRRTGNEFVGLILPVGETCCAFLVDGGTISGLELVDKRLVGQLIGTPAAVRQKGPLANGVAHELKITVFQQGTNASIQASVDGNQLTSWKGGVSQISLPGTHALPNPHGIGVLPHLSIVDIHELKLELKRGSRGFRLGDDWKNPLFVVVDKPTPDVAKRCLTWNGQKYFISDKPLSLSDAQLLATQLKGRLLTISTANEEKFIFEHGRGVSLWMAGWRPPSASLPWRDERNRPLRYLSKWATSQPDSAGGVEWNLSISKSGWNDVATEQGGIHACIEWGEEYPEDLETDAK